ncbi:hypothetical protein PUNSTDRAFT_90339 [Punctularia strigosozonata HHB-11173 SS5]|uniref:uncharacterized protein n=1 Tax=Punctularia strigosozonata (strain HHB-11173) TaxID=741275 RepID=UPI0004417D7D|nr:uncharacterized protein PUNSTDRAFT_90339 [Punctularia strigosozonata HHB-11173 SS5]EIN06636.1 hypothetical protein PUNSTDRAFT_90339 [Punctularia strigosozonata HHB-11173 SS5]
MGWGGTKSLLVPMAVKHTVGMLQSNAQEVRAGMLRLLVTFKTQGVLGHAEVDMVWRQRVGQWAVERLDGFQLSEEQVEEMHDILALSPLLPTMAPSLVSIVEKVLITNDPKADYAASPANAAWVLRSCMSALVKRDKTDWEPDKYVSCWVRKVVEKWSWSEVALEGVVKLTKSSTSNDAIPVDEVLAFLQDSLLSHSHALRVNALRLLTSEVVERARYKDVLDRCLQCDEVPADVSGVRERVLRMGRLSQVLKDDDKTGAEICARWLVAQLKVNLRPLWVPAAQALSQLAQRFDDATWKVLFGQLRTVSTGAADETKPAWTRSDSDEDPDDVREEEHSWRDPSAFKLRTTLYIWLFGKPVRKAIVKSQTPRDRFDPTSYETQLLSTLGSCPWLAEKHNRELVPFFLSLSGTDDSSRLPRQKLAPWLTLFAEFKNPKALSSTDTLHSLYVSLLSHPDRSIQSAALSCLLTYRSPHLLPYEDTCRALLDDTRWRDALSGLNIAEIEAQNRVEAVDLIVRLLYGVMLEKRGRARGADRRAATLGALAGCTDDELRLVVDLMLKPIQPVRLTTSSENFVIMPLPPSVAERQQVGFLTLLGDLLKYLGSRIVHTWPALIGSTMDILADAEKRINAVTAEIDGEDNDVEDIAEDAEDIATDAKFTKVRRSIRQLGLKRFGDFFRTPSQFDFTPYLPAAFNFFISNRLPVLDRENTQAPSALLDLFYVWSKQAEYARFLVSFDDRVLPKVYACLVATNVKPAVVSRIFDIVEALLALSNEDGELKRLVVEPHVSLLLSNLASLVQRTKDFTTVSGPLPHRQISILSEVAPFIRDSPQASTLLSLFLPLLRKPSKSVNEKIKTNMLRIVDHLLAFVPELVDHTTAVAQKTLEVLSELFQSMRSRPGRLALLSTLRRLADVDESLVRVADLLESMNAFSKKRLDEPDFDRRLTAFATMNEEAHATLTAREWLPILYNSLHFIQDPEELAVRNNAAQSLKRFIDLCANAELTTDLGHVMVRVLFPALKNGLRTKSEMVRAEVLSVMAHAVKNRLAIKALQEMQPLLADGDEEASFFTNVLHVQIHRRTRALRRLAESCAKSQLSSSTLADIFVPLVGHFITSPATTDHHLVNEAITTTGHMAEQLNWGPYFSLVQSYLRLVRLRDESERVYVRTVVSILDHFHFPMDQVLPQPERAAEDVTLMGEEAEAETAIQAAEDRKVIQQADRIADAVTSRLLPSLLKHLETRNETEDSLRIPISIGIVKVAIHLPREAREPQVLRLLTVVSQILRSKSQETRDLVRETMCRIAVILGGAYLPIIFQELRTALVRGPQLHVLAAVTHTLLVHVTSPEHVQSFDPLDECVDHVAHISAEVVFGESGKDVQHEDFKTKMREVRSSANKALDSFGIISKFITPPKISRVLLPVRDIMQQTEALKVMNQCEDVLRRVVIGLNANSHLVPKEQLVLCHTLISQNARFLTERKSVTKSKKGNQRAIVQLKRKVTIDTDHYANNAFRFVVLGLDLFHTAFKRSRFDFHDPEIIARLEPMVKVIGNTLYSSNSQVLVLGLKASAAIVRCPLKSLEKSTPVFVNQIIDILKQAGSTESDVAQTALKSLASMIRDCSSVHVKEKDLVYLLELLEPDLEDPDRQTAVFAMLRAIVSRKFVVPEIYDMMEKVLEIMVTSQSTHVQELCRGVLLQFLLDYPQGKGRLRKQMTFLAKNLSYIYESGRKSVMELLSAVLAKFDAALIQEYLELLFVGLVMVIANDDSSKCREMAAELIKNLLARLDEDRRRLIISHQHSWAAQRTNLRLCSVSAQICGLVLDSFHQDTAPYLASFLEDLVALLQLSAERMQGDGDEEDWKTPYHVLVVLGKVFRDFPDRKDSISVIPWDSVAEHLLFPHAWVRLAACRLIGVLFSVRAELLEDVAFDGFVPISESGLKSIAEKLCEDLKSDHLDSPMSLQVVKNLFFVGKRFCERPLPSPSESDSPEAEEDDREGADDEIDEPETSVKDDHPLPWLFSKLSYQCRSAHIARRNTSSVSEHWFEQPTAILKWFAAMASHMEPALLSRFLTHILSPVYRIVDDDTIRDPHMDELKTLAIELQDLVQAKVGVTAFTTVYNRIRQSVLGVRRDRKATRVMQGTINPQAAAKRKAARNENKKDSRKRKAYSFKDKLFRGSKRPRTH